MYVCVRLEVYDPNDLECAETVAGASASPGSVDANAEAAANTAGISTPALNIGDDGNALSLRELLLLQRQRLEQSKQNFFLSSSPSSCAPSPIPMMMTMMMATADETSTTTQTVRPTNEDDDIEEGLDIEVENEDDIDGTDEIRLEEQLNQKTSDNVRDCETLQVSDLSKRNNSKMNRKTVSKNIEKSPSASSSLHLFYSQIVRKIPYTGSGSGRKHLSSNTDDDDVDGGVCDVSGGDLSDDYDHCDIELRDKLKPRSATKSLVLSDDSSGRGGQQLTPGTGTGSDIEYHGDIEGESTHQEGFYETSDTGGELTNTDDIDIDSSMNLLSNLSCNSSNSNTSIEKRISLNRHRNAHNLQLSAMGSPSPSMASKPKRTANTALGAFESTKQKTAAKPILAPTRGQPHHNHPALSSPNSSDCSSASPIPLRPPPPLGHPASAPHPLSPVGRSKSFQEPGVKMHSQSPTTRYKKYARIFQRRRSKRSNANKTEGKNVHSNYSLDTMYQNIEITIQDEDGNYQPYDDNYDTYDRHRRSHEIIGNDEEDDDDDDDEEVLKEYSQFLGNRLRPYHHSSSGGCGGGIHSDDGGGGDISDGASSRSRSRLSDNEHVFGKLLKRMRRFSMGWRKPRYHKRRGDFLLLIFLNINFSFCKIKLKNTFIFYFL